MEWDGLKVKQLRLRLGWCTANMARRLDCSQRTILSWELGESLPDSRYFSPLKTLLSFAEANAEWIKQSNLADNLIRENGLQQINREEIYRLTDKV